MNIFDTHAHINYKASDAEVALTMSESLSNSIDKIMMPAIDIGQIPRMRRLSETYEGLYYSVGLHPTYSGEITTGELVSMSDHPKCKAIGECGYDFHWKKIGYEEQKARLQSHIDASIETNKPLIIHSRDADEICLNHLKGSNLNSPFIMHCFSSDPFIVKRYLDLDCFISFAGNITRSNFSHIRESASFVPKDRFLIETDSPYMQPQGVKGKNKPSNIIHTITKLSEVMGISSDEVIINSYNNALRVFKLQAD